MECNKSRNLTQCNCSYEHCSRKGICCECISYHLKYRQFPACCFPDDAERTPTTGRLNILPGWWKQTGFSLEIRNDRYGISKF